jgi:Glycosyl transferase family 2
MDVQVRTAGMWHLGAMFSRVAAHLILGPREEPFLGSLLESLQDACGMLLVNDNSADPSPHEATLSESAFARENRLIVDRTPFRDFAAARNICIRLHHEHDAGEWMLFVDADEVHGPQLERIARNLDRVPAEVGFIDGYTWHFFQSFDWYRSIERAKMFIRMSPDLQWEGIVHEKMLGANGSRIALPYVFGHYGWVLPIERQAAKERLYASLGRPGKMLPPEELNAPDLERSFREEWRTVLRFRGAHPPAVRPTIARLREGLHAQFAAVDEIVPRNQSTPDRIRNALMRVNYEQRWRLRALSAPARRLLA